MEYKAESDFEKAYSDGSFWDKVKKHSGTAGKELVGKSLELYYAMQSLNTPLWAKGVICGALGYFISPIDAIPDIVPLIGYADDLGVLVAATATVGLHITEDIKVKAKQKLKDWFG